MVEEAKARSVRCADQPWHQLHAHQPLEASRAAGPQGGGEHRLAGAAPEIPELSRPFRSRLANVNVLPQRAC